MRIRKIAPRWPARPALPEARTGARVEALEPRRLMSGVATLDPTFGANGSGAVTLPFPPGAIAGQADNKILVTSATAPNSVDFIIARYDATGALDTGQPLFERIAFQDPAARYPYALDLARQADGKVVVAGFAVPTNQPNPAVTTLEVVRLNADGTYDTTFGTNGNISHPFPYSAARLNALAIQPDGKIVVAGNVNLAGGQTRQMLAVRFNANGTLDTTFAGKGYLTDPFPGTVNPPNVSADEVTLQPDGKMVLVGRLPPFDPVLGTSHTLALARYNADGTLDTTFGTGGRVVDAVPLEFGRSDIYPVRARVEADGKITVAGSATGGIGLVRFNPDGTPDATFGTNGVLASPARAPLNPRPLNPEPPATPYANNIGLLALAFDGRFLASNGQVLERLQGLTALDAPPPTASLASLPPVAAGSRAYSFSVVFTGQSALDASSFGSKNILVSGPNGYAVDATLAGVANGGGRAGRKGMVKVATYSIPAPGGKHARWSAAANGRYVISLLDHQVQDTAGAFARAARLGRLTVAFTAALARPAPPAASDPAASRDVEAADPFISPGIALTPANLAPLGLPAHAWNSVEDDDMVLR